MARAVVDLDASATVLDAAERVAGAPAEGDLVIVAAAGAPLLRNAVFLDVLRAQADQRRLSLVTGDARARSLAAAVHMSAYASLAALERHELDPTERLAPARRAAIAGARTVGPAGPRASAGRILAVAGSLGSAGLILLAVLVPEARVVVAPTVRPLGPIELTIRATPGGEVTPTPLGATVTAKVTGTATGSRIEETKATGTVQLQNKTTDEIRISKGTVFQTSNGIRFLATQDRTLPQSVVIPPFTLLVGKADIPVEAAVAGTGGNVPAGRITVGPSRSRYEVTNPTPTTGGDVKRIPVVKLEDYDAAVKKAPEALRAAAEEQLRGWTREPRLGLQVIQRVLVRQTSIAPSNVDVAGKEAETFELTVSGIASAYAVPDVEPRRTALARLRDAVEPGNEVDDRAAVVEVKKAEVGDGGVTWTVSARASQMRRMDRERIGRLLAGRVVGDAQPVLDAEGLRLVRLDRVPAWWPLLPVLDGRITVQVEPPPVTRPARP